MYFPDDYYTVLGAVQKYAEENGVYHKHHTKPGFYDLCTSLWDNCNHWSVGRFRSLSMVNRFICCNTKREYNVAVHSYNVAMLCMIIISEIEHHGFDLMPEFIREVYERALLHDCTESLSMDIPYSVKNSFNQYVEDVVNKNVNLLCLDEDLTTIAVRPDDESGYVNFFVRIVDTMELTLFCLEEEALGYTVVDHGQRALDICIDIIKSKYRCKLKSMKDASNEQLDEVDGLMVCLDDFVQFIEGQDKKLLCSTSTNH